MQIRYLNLVLLLSLIATFQCKNIQLIQLFKDNSNEQLLKLKSSDKYISTVQVSLDSGNSIVEVTFLLQDLIKDLSKQILKATKENVFFNQKIEKEINYYKALLKQLDDIELKTSTQINNLETSIRKAKQQKRSANTQLKIARERAKLLNEARDLDYAAYVKRTARQEGKLNAINFIINELQNALDADQFIQLEQVIQNIKDTQQYSQMQVFVDLTMTFNKNTVEQVIAALTKIKISIEQSLKDEEKLEFQAKEEYVYLNNELADFININLKKINALSKQINIWDAELFDLQKELEQIQKVIVVNKALLKQAIYEKDEENKIYQENQKQRKSEIEICNQVIKILEQNKQKFNSDKQSFVQYSV